MKTEKKSIKDVKFSIDEQNKQTVNVGAFVASHGVKTHMWCSGVFCICADTDSAKRLVNHLNKMPEKHKVKLIQ